MRITLTGASGFIGGKLVSRLLNDGHQLTILARKPKQGANPRYMVWDALKEDPPALAFDGCDAVIHMAGAPIAQPWSKQVKQEIRDSRVDGTRRLVSTLRDLPTKPGTLVAASAIGIYGSRGDEILTESSAPGQGFLAEVTVDWEAESRQAEALGMRVVEMRTGVVLGEDGALAKMLPPFRMGVGGPLAGGRQWMSWIDLDDQVELYVFALNNEKVKGPVNATAPNPVTNAEFTEKLGKAVHRPAFIPVPAFAIKAIFGEMGSVVLASQRVLPEVALENGFQFRCPRLEQSLARQVR